MDLYVVSLATGAVGLGIMAVGGLSHGNHAGHSHGGHDAHVGHTGHAHAAQGHDANGHHAQHGAGPHAPGTAPGWSWTSLLSPRLLFSLMVGFGAGRIAATPVGEPWQFGAALLASAAFEMLLVGPLWRFLFRFESPATI